MKTINIKTLLLTCTALIFLLSSTQAQEFRKPISPDEEAFLATAFATMVEDDQRYRSYLTYHTLDDQIIARIDSIMENDDIVAGMQYAESLNLSLSEETMDSLQDLQHQLDFQNHLMIRGVWEIYGYISEDLIKENNYIQLMLLVHPQKDWDIPTYHLEYGNLLRKEVDAGRMPAKMYATFYDNILGKIMRKPQLYGTNQMYSREAGKILPPLIENLEKANEAREELGMEKLKEGEYRLAN